MNFTFFFCIPVLLQSPCIILLLTYTTSVIQKLSCFQILRTSVFLCLLNTFCLTISAVHRLPASKNQKSAPLSSPLFIQTLNSYLVSALRQVSIIVLLFRVTAKLAPAFRWCDPESIRTPGTVLAALLGLWKGREWDQKVLNLRLIKQ